MMLSGDMSKRQFDLWWNISSLIKSNQFKCKDEHDHRVTDLSGLCHWWSFVYNELICHISVSPNEKSMEGEAVCAYQGPRQVIFVRGVKSDSSWLSMSLRGAREGSSSPNDPPTPLLLPPSLLCLSTPPPRSGCACTAAAERLLIHAAQTAGAASLRRVAPFKFSRRRHLLVASEKFAVSSDTRPEAAVFLLLFF